MNLQWTVLFFYRNFIHFLEFTKQLKTAHREHRHVTDISATKRSLLRFVYLDGISRTVCQFCNKSMQIMLNVCQTLCTIYYIWVHRKDMDMLMALIDLSSMLCIWFGIYQLCTVTYRVSVKAFTDFYGDFQFDTHLFPTKVKKRTTDNYNCSAATNQFLGTRYVSCSCTTFKIVNLIGIFTIIFGPFVKYGNVRFFQRVHFSNALFQNWITKFDF